MMPDKTIQWLVEQNWSSPIALLEIDGLWVAQSVIGFGEAAVQIRETEALFTVICLNYLYCEILITFM